MRKILKTKILQNSKKFNFYSCHFKLSQTIIKETRKNHALGSVKRKIVFLRRLFTLMNWPPEDGQKPTSGFFLHTKNINILQLTWLGESRAVEPARTWLPLRWPWLGISPCVHHLALPGSKLFVTRNVHKIMHQRVTGPRWPIGLVENLFRCPNRWRNALPSNKGAFRKIPRLTLDCQGNPLGTNDQGERV